jgi:hypothetical protein
MLFTKNRGKQIIEGLEGFNDNGNSAKSEIEPGNGSNKPQEVHSKDFDK